MFAPADYVLRPLTPHDEAMLWDMLYEAISREDDEPPRREIVRRPEYARFVKGWGSPGDRGFVAFEKAEEAFLGAVWLRGNLEGEPADAAPVLAFVVRPGHRQRGIGASLLTQFIRANPSLDAIALRVRADSAAVRLMERFGFEVASQGDNAVVVRRQL